jgi:hypothetical protein
MHVPASTHGSGGRGPVSRGPLSRGEGESLAKASLATASVAPAPSRGEAASAAGPTFECVEDEEQAKTEATMAPASAKEQRKPRRCGQSRFTRRFYTSERNMDVS